MKEVITSREEALLAKIAGREDAGLETFTPSTPANLKEKLLLEIADRLDNGGGSEPELEVVAEIEIGEMTKVDGAEFWYYQTDFTPPQDRTLYFNDASTPLTFLSHDDGGPAWYRNLDLETLRPIDETELAYFISVDGNGDNAVIAASTNSISNTTIRLLSEPTSGGGSGGLPDVTPDDNDKVLTVVEGKWQAADLPDDTMLIVKYAVDGSTVTKQGATYNELTSALTSNNPVVAYISKSSNVYIASVHFDTHNGEITSIATVYNGTSFIHLGVIETHTGTLSPITDAT